MTMHTHRATLGRRRFAGLSLAAIGLLPLASCAGTDRSGALRVSFYGEPDVTEALNSALAVLHRHHPSLATTTESGGFEGYYDKLATRFGSGSAPDVVMMDFTHLAGYAERGALLDLTEEVPDPIDPAKGRPGVMDGCRSDGRLYGVPIGVHSQAMVVRERTVRDHGLELPTAVDTWEVYERTCADIFAGGDGKVYGTEDGGGRDLVLDVWVRQRGGNLFTEDGRLGFPREHLRDWFEFWHRMRKHGGAVPIDITANPTVPPLVAGQAMMGFAFSSITGLQNQVDEDLSILPIPATSDGDAPAAHQYIKPTNLLSVNRKGPSIERSVRVVAEFLANAAVGRRLGISLGSPPAREVFARVAEGSSGVAARILRFDAMVQRNADGAFPPTRPIGADQLLTATGALLDRLNKSVGYGQVTPKEAAEQFFTQSKSYLLGAG